MLVQNVCVIGAKYLGILFFQKSRGKFPTFFCASFSAGLRVA